MATGREKFLRVAEAKPADAGRGVVHLDPEVMKILDLKEGDVVLILGAKATAAGVRRGYPEASRYSGRLVVRGGQAGRLNGRKTRRDADEGQKLRRRDAARSRRTERWLGLILAAIATPAPTAPVHIEWP